MAINYELVASFKELPSTEAKQALADYALEFGVTLARNLTFDNMLAKLEEAVPAPAADLEEAKVEGYAVDADLAPHIQQMIDAGEVPAQMASLISTLKFHSVDHSARQGTKMMVCHTVRTGVVHAMWAHAVDNGNAAGWVDADVDFTEADLLAVTKGGSKIGLDPTAKFAAIPTITGQAVTDLKEWVAAILVCVKAAKAAGYDYCVIRDPASSWFYSLTDDANAMSGPFKNFRFMEGNITV